MKLYKIPQTSMPPEFVGTQVKAMQECRERGLKFDPEAMAVDVPTDKPSLLKWLNENAIVDQAPAAIDPLEAAELRAVAAATPSPGAQPALTAGDVVSFILDDATVAQVETIFAALGTRFKEQLNGTR